MTLKEIRAQLQTAGYKLTSQREATVVTLLNHKNQQLTAEEIFILVKNKNAEIGLATVYRTLELLVELRIIAKVHFEDGITRYDVVDMNMLNRRYYLVCNKCGAIETVTNQLIANINKVIATTSQFEVLDCSLTFKGICRLCQTNEKSPSIVKEELNDRTANR